MLRDDENDTRQCQDEIAHTYMTNYTEWLSDNLNMNKHTTARAS